MDFQIDQPLGKMFTILGKGYLNLIRMKLQHLDIDRNYYALVLIESHEGQITQQELSVKLNTDKVSIVRVVDYLSGKGYVKRIRKTDDRRKHTLLLTEKAIQALPEIKQSFIEVNQIVLKGFENSKISELAGYIKKIETNITENSYTP